MNKVTISDVAAAAGVHKMTVSRALRNLPSISESTRERVKEAARRLGYRPNPYVAALMTQVRERHVGNVVMPLAVLYEAGTLEHFREHPIRRELLEGVQHEAKSLNLKIEFHAYQGETRHNAKLEQILYARGIRATVVLAPVTPFLEVDLEFEHIAPIGIGHRLRRPWIHRVGSDHMGNTEIAFDNLRSDGFRRIGYVTENSIEKHSFSARLNAVRFLSERDLPKADRVPPFIAKDRDLVGLKAWHQKHRPDVLLLAGYTAIPGERVLEILVDPVPLVYLALTRRRPELTGVVEANEEIGSLAVRLALHAAAVGLSGHAVARCSSLLTGRYQRAGEPKEAEKPTEVRELAARDVL